MVASPAQRFTPGQLVAGRYVVEALLGQGGMASVCCVRDQRSGRRVALKRGRAADASKREKRGVLLQREFHTLSQLAHPRIIEVYDYGVDDEGPYYTMELLDGSDLSHAGRLPWREACALLNDVASSLAILHSRGLIHRDVSSRNVRRTADGRAKLFDFGAMQPMGVPRDVVGTPPFMAPEALHMQELDPRADLFSLGALGYLLVTGRHAYPARRLGELRDIWRSLPAAAARLVPEIPAALSSLLMELLALDRTARPQSAGAVMERLSGIASLPREASVDVSRAYLAAPVLIGRDTALAAVRRRMLSLVRRDGGTLLISGSAGSGRSRMLDACALEAKLLGAYVVRADALDGSRGDWGVARALCTALCEILPDEAAAAARLSRHVLGHVVPELRGERWRPTRVPDRSRLIRDLRDFVLALVRGQRLVLLIDDADHIDELSAALIAALAHKAEGHPLILAVAIDRDGPHARSASLRLLHSVAHLVELDALAADQTETLMRSVFGEAPHLRTVAARVHGLSLGSPRTAMELAQHLVDRGLARYEAGTWILPARLDENDLPNGLSASLRQRLDGLQADAIELAEALALCDRDPVALPDYPAVTSHGDLTRVFEALDELVAARVLVADAEHYSFSQRGFVAVLCDGMPEERRRATHSRIADLLAKRDAEPLRRVEHLLYAGRDAEAIDLLDSLDLLSLLPPLALLERAAERATELGAPARTIQRLHMAALSKASLEMATVSFECSAAHVLGRLELDSGLARCRELAHLPAEERLRQALFEAAERYRETPERERAYSTTEAVRELARLSGACASMAVSSLDPSLLASLPSLEPLEPLSPALRCVAQIVDGAREWTAGRALRAKEHYEQVLERIAQPDRAGFDDAQHARTHLGINYALALFESATGSDRAEQRAERLERDRALRVNAWLVRKLVRLYRGDAIGARKCGRQAEILQLQEGLEPRYLTTTAGYELRAYVAAGDILGVKATVESLAMMASAHPGWRPVLAYGQAQLSLMQGDPEKALVQLSPAFEQALPGQHAFFAFLAGAHLAALNAAGRLPEALDYASRYLAICEREGLFATDQYVDVGAAHAWSLAGMHERATQAMDAVLAKAGELGKTGLALGVLFEERARIALRMDDYAGFDRFAECCAGEYNRVANPLLSARFTRLLEEARAREDAPISLAQQGQGTMTLSQTQSGFESVHSRMRECFDRGDRARCALTILLQNTEGYTGWLYGVEADGKVTPLAAVPEAEPRAELTSWVERVVAAEFVAISHPASATAEEEGGTITQDGDTQSDIAPRYVDGQGNSFEPTPLFAGHGGQRRIAAILVRNIPRGARRVPNRMLMSTIAEELVSHGDSPGMLLA